jgi:hypothetical protein
MYCLLFKVESRSGNTGYRQLYSVRIWQNKTITDRDIITRRTQQYKSTILYASDSDPDPHSICVLVRIGIRNADPDPDAFKLVQKLKFASIDNILTHKTRQKICNANIFLPNYI